MPAPRLIVLTTAALIFVSLIAYPFLPHFSRGQYDARTISSRTVAGYTLPFGIELVTSVSTDPEPEMLRILREQRALTPTPDWETACTRTTWRGVACSFPSRCAIDFQYIADYTEMIGLTDPDQLLSLYYNMMRVADTERDDRDTEVQLMMDYDHDSAIWCLVDNEPVILWERNPGDAAREIQTHSP